MLPLMAAAFISVLHWPALRALVGLARDPDPSIRLKREPLPAAYVAADLSAIAVFEVLPYLEELWQDWRANPAASPRPRGAASGGAETGRLIIGETRLPGEAHR